MFHVQREDEPLYHRQANSVSARAPSIDETNPLMQTIPLLDEMNCFY